MIVVGCSAGSSSDNAVEQASPASSELSQPAGTDQAGEAEAAVAESPASEPSPDAEPTPDGAASEPVRIDVLVPVAADTSSRLRELPNFGYGIRPAAGSGFYEVPELEERFPRVVVQAHDVIWGIDSSALMVVVTGDAEDLAQAKPLLNDSTRWVLEGESWLIAVYQGGLSAGWEMTDLSDTISAVMNPDQACELPVAVCPHGQQWFPPPPPQLLANGPVKAPEYLFQVSMVEGAAAIEVSSIEASWIDDDGQAFSTTGYPPDPTSAIARGPALAAETIGGFAFIADPGDAATHDPHIAFRVAQGQQPDRVWDIPDGWHITGLAMLGHFRQDDYRLVITADRDPAVTATAGSPPTDSIAVSMPFDEQIFGPAGSGFDDDRPANLADLAPLNLDGVRWSLPQRSRSGLLLVVEEREDGWYLVSYTDADRDRADRVELLRSSHAISSYSADGGGRNIVLAIDGPNGPSNWLVRDRVVTELEGSATSLAWLGRHSAWLG